MTVEERAREIVITHLEQASDSVRREWQQIIAQALRDYVSAENARLKAEVAVLKPGLDYMSAKNEQMRREAVELNAELEAARNVAEAAVFWADLTKSPYECMEAQLALIKAVRKYRERVEGKTNDE